MSGYIFEKKIVFFCLKIFFTFTDSVDLDEMQHYAAFQSGSSMLLKELILGFPKYKGLKNLYLGQPEIWALSLCQATKAKVTLHNCTDLSEPSLLT